MSKYERKISDPQYINEYVSGEVVKETYNDKFLSFVIFLTVFVFFTSIADLIYSYLNIDNCQEHTYIAPLNNWLRISGIYGILYYFIMIIMIYFLYNTTHYFSKNGYTSLVNTFQKNLSEKNYYTFKAFSTLFTSMMLILFTIESFSYFYYFNNICTNYSLILYMWIRLIIGLLSCIFIIIFINYK